MAEAGYVRFDKLVPDRLPRACAHGPSLSGQEASTSASRA